MRTKFAFGLVVLLTGSAFGQAQPDAVDLLTKVKDALKDLKSYDLHLAVSIRDPGAIQDQVSDLRVAATMAPEKYRVVYGSEDAANPAPGDGTMIYDGETFWVYLPARNAYRMGKMTPDKLGRDAKPAKVNQDTGIGQYTQLVERFNMSHFLREESLSQAGARVDCFVVEKAPGVMMWIDKSNYHVLRAEEIDPDGTHSTAVIGLRLNEPIAADVFTLVPPPGSRNLGPP